MLAASFSSSTIAHSWLYAEDLCPSRFPFLGCQSIRKNRMALTNRWRVSITPLLNVISDRSTCTVFVTCQLWKLRLK